MAEVKAVIFDCFGVLVAPVQYLAYRDLGGDVEKDKARLEEMFRQYDLGMINRREMHETLASWLKVSVEEWRAVTRDYSSKDQKLLRFVAGLRPRYKTGVVTNIGAETFYQVFTKEEVSQYFDVVVLSSEERVMKPDPRIYQITVDRLGVAAASCVFIDDLQPNVAGAAKAGMRGILYTSFDQLMGELAKLGVSDG